MTDSLSPELQALLDKFPNAAKRGGTSKLEKYWPLIKAWRKRGKTYLEIRNHLIEAGIFETLSTATLYNFLKRRSRPRKEESEPVTESDSSSPDHQQSLNLRRLKLSEEELKARREKARASNHKPIFEKPAVAEDERVTFDIGKPRENRNLQPPTIKKRT